MNGTNRELERDQVRTRDEMQIGQIAHNPLNSLKLVVVVAKTVSCNNQKKNIHVDFR